MAVKVRRKIINVRGSGLFPIDMLRYDHCWPRSEEDSYRVSADYRDEQNPPELRDIELLTDSENVGGPRWASFSWQVCRCSSRDFYDIGDEYGTRRCPYGSASIQMSQVWCSDW